MLKECKEFCKDWRVNLFAAFAVIACTIIGLIFRFVPEKWIQWVIDKLFGKAEGKV